METSLDLSRWRETPRGVAYRRWVIISTGLKQLLRTRFFQILIVMAWFAGFLMATLGFLFSQLVATGGWVETLAAKAGPRAEAIASIFNGFVALYPDIVIRALFTSIFWLHSFLGLGLSLIALTVMVPRLITRDRATNALTVYFSRPLTSGDYLFGKLGLIVGILALLWTGPLLFGWVLSLGFSPGRDFLVYSFLPLQRALLFNGIALVALAAIALGASALGRSSRNVIVIWIGLWLILGIPAQAPNAPRWIQRLSFTHDLGQVRQSVFQLDDALEAASAQLPLFDKRLARKIGEAGKAAEATDFGGALASLALFCGLSTLVFFRRLRPE